MGEGDRKERGMLTLHAYQNISVSFACIVEVFFCILYGRIISFLTRRPDGKALLDEDLTLNAQSSSGLGNMHKSSPGP